LLSISLRFLLFSINYCAVLYGTVPKIKKKKSINPIFLAENCSKLFGVFGKPADN